MPPTHDTQPVFTGHFEQDVVLPERAAVVFEHLDDFERLGAHMMRSSWMMAGSHMHYEFDASRGRALHAKVGLRGSMLGLRLTIDEEIVERTPPTVKAWQTIGTPRMLVLSAYRMGYALAPEQNGCRLKVFIDYAFPPRGFAGWLARIAGPMYARWCVISMIEDAVRVFGKGAAPTAAAGVPTSAR